MGNSDFKHHGYRFQFILYLYSVVLLLIMYPLVSETKELDRSMDKWVYYDGQIMKLFETKLSFNNSRRYCEESGGFLLTDDSVEKSQFISDTFLPVPDKTWIGLFEVKSKKTWMWVSGKPYLYLNWGNQEPNNYGGLPEDCGSIPWWTSQWSDETCSHPLAFICEKDVKNGDVLPCPTRWIPYRGYCYRHFKTALTFDMADSACMNQGAYLASIVDDAERLFIAYIGHLKSTNFTLWLGGVKDDQSYRWHDGTPFSYQAWKPYISSRYSSMYMTPSGLWNLEDASKEKQFVCKMAFCEQGWPNKGSNCISERPQQKPTNAGCVNISTSEGNTPEQQPYISHQPTVIALSVIGALELLLLIAFIAGFVAVLRKRRKNHNRDTVKSKSEERAQTNESVEPAAPSGGYEIPTGNGNAQYPHPYLGLMQESATDEPRLSPDYLEIQPEPEYAETYSNKKNRALPDLPVTCSN